MNGQVFGLVPRRPRAGTRRQWQRALLVTVLLAGLLALLHSSVAVSAATMAGQARAWAPGVVYMQIGPSCVGYALAAWLDASPNSIQQHADGWQIYQAAQAVDGIPGSHQGSSVQAGLHVLAGLGYVRAWQPTHDTGTALAFLRTHGPIVLEGDFPDDLPVLDSAQNLRWQGTLVRHAWLCYGVDATGRLSCQNSNSTAWNRAEAGRFHMTSAALAAVLSHGQAWLITKPATGSA